MLPPHLSDFRIFRIILHESPPQNNLAHNLDFNYLAWAECHTNFNISLDRY